MDSKYDWGARVLLLVKLSDIYLPLGLAVGCIQDGRFNYVKNDKKVEGSMRAEFEERDILNPSASQRKNNIYLHSIIARIPFLRNSRRPLDEAACAHNDQIC